jgi:hypothetical protein
VSRPPTNIAQTLAGETPDAAFKRLSGAKPTGKKHKYGAQRTGRYASKLEAKVAGEIETLMRAGRILDWVEQVPVRLPGGIRYLIDFMVLDVDGTVRFIECKGVETRVWTNKLRQLAELHPHIHERLAVRR